MVRIGLAAICVAAALTAPIPADAYTVRGAGKCATWVGGTDDRFWVLGFISGNNYARDANIGRNIDVNDIYRFVSRYCSQNPKDDLADAAVAYLRTN